MREVQALKVWKEGKSESEIDLEVIQGTVVNVQASEKSIGFVTQDGELYIVGEDFIQSSYKEPSLIQAFAQMKIKIRHVALGASHALAVGEDPLSNFSHVYSWGSNIYG